MKAYYFDGSSGEIIRKEEIPEKLVDFCKEKKMDLISALAENDEKMEEYYLEENIDIPDAEIKECIRRLTIKLEFCPVFMGSAFKNKGV